MNKCVRDDNVCNINTTQKHLNIYNKMLRNLSFEFDGFVQFNHVNVCNWEYMTINRTCYVNKTAC